MAIRKLGTNTNTDIQKQPITVPQSLTSITYQVFTDTSGWLPTVSNLEDYAGVDGQPIKGIRVYLNGDTSCSSDASAV